MNNQKIELYKERLFSDKFTATFDFVKENWRTVLRFMSYLVLPVCLLQSAGLQTIFGTAMLSAAGKLADNAEIVQMLTAYGLYFICILVGLLLITALVYGLMKVYDERADRLSGLTMSEFRPTLWHFLKRTAAIMAAMIPIALLIGAAVGGIFMLLALVDPILMTVSLLPIYFAAIAVALPLTLATPMYLMNDDMKVYTAIGKAFRYGWKTWGGLFGIMFVVGLIVQVVMTIAMTPYMVVIIIKAVMATSDEPATGFMANTGLQALTYVLGIVQSFGMYLGYVIMYVAIGYHYGHVMERYEGVSAQRGIDNFESLADNNADDSHLFEALNEIDNFDKL